MSRRGTLLREVDAALHVMLKNGNKKTIGWENITGNLFQGLPFQEEEQLWRG
jgi:hypothetical protein